LGLLALIL